MLDTAEIRFTVADVLVDLLKIDPNIDGSADLVDHGLTSFESVTLVLTLEERFGLSFPDSMLLLDNFLTVDRIVNLVETVLGNESVGRSA